MKELRPYQQKAVQECWEALKQNDEPVLLMASVGAGKSLMLASILLTMQNLGKKALCLVNNAELVRNNCATFVEQGGKSSIYCAALDSKDISQSVIFGTPQSVLNGISKSEPIADVIFNIIIVDEAHAINYINDRSGFMRILRHYKQRYPEMRLLGATGTNFRFKGSSIVGPECLFKSQVGNITTESLIDTGYLINPNFAVDRNLVIDFSNVKLKQNGQFDQKQLEAVVEGSTRLTALICKQVIHIVEKQNRFGCFLFATTKKHAYEILSHLPETQSALILGETPQHEREGILNAARRGDVKYVVNIAIISVGVDVPAFDTLAYLRPTESLVLLVQTMGRVLRLSPNTNKKESLVLDFAGNIERHKDWDNPLLLKALKQTEDHDKPRVIICPACQEMNTDTARRCVGSTNNARCDYYFEFKECPNEQCKSKNDIASRHCRTCNAEIIDPNKKLRLETVIKNKELKEFHVLSAKYAISYKSAHFRVNCMYTCADLKGKVSNLYESYTPSSDKAKHVFYGQFIKKHCANPSQWYTHMKDKIKMTEMLYGVESPSKLFVKEIDNGYRITKKIFNQPGKAI